MDKTEQILKHDSIAETEKVIGKKHHSEFNKSEQTLSVLRFMADNQTKKEHLKSIGDTYWGMDWGTFKQMLVDFGFEVGLSYNLQDCHSENIEEAIIYYHPTKGLILWATSYSGQKSINGGTCYGEIEAVDTDEDRFTIRQWMSTGGRKGGNIYETSFDVREGLFHRMSMLESAGEFQKEWTDKNRFLWFLDWNDTKEDDYDYEEITKERLLKCPAGMQAICSGQYSKSTTLES